MVKVNEWLRRMSGAMPTTALFCFLAVVAHLFGADGNSKGTARMTVVTSSTIKAYQEALEGFKASLGTDSSRLTVVDLAGSNARGDLSAALESKPPLMVAIGVGAMRELASQENPIPFVSTMILRSQAPQPRLTPGAPVGAVSLDVSFTRVLTEIKKVFPGKTRLAIIRNPSTPGQSARELQQQAERNGFKVRVIDCHGPEQLLEMFLAQKGKVDFVWSPPDASLYNATTIRPLILASLKNRIPIIGFSASFVRSGPAVGIYPDYRDIGRQTAEVVREYIDEQTPIGNQELRKVQVAVNQRVLRILGLRFKPSEAGAGHVVVLR